MQTMNRDGTPSTRPYLIRALHEWCTDQGFSPYLAVQVDASVQVPREYVKNHEIVLNVSFDATSNLRLGNDFIEFKARFGGVPRDIVVPVDHVVAIYAKENGQGMAFPAPPTVSEVAPEATGKDTANGKPLQLVSAGSKEDEAPPPEPGPGGGDGSGAPRPALKRVK